jgi:Fe2+ or Zn2+ uptake regulation protein
MMNRRSTIQRSLVLEAVKESQGHVTADEIYEKVAKKHSYISRGTVYRNLNLLSDIGEIRKVELPDGADRFEYNNTEHYHVRCVKCNRVFDVDMEFMADLEKKIKDVHGFQFTGHDIIFKGICPTCNQK